MANIPISSFTAAANATGIGMSGFSLTGANAQSMLDLAGTWNTTGTPTGLKLNVTDTASNAASLLMDLQVGGSSRFSVRKDGLIKGSSNSTVTIATDITLTNPNATRPINIEGFANFTSAIAIGQSVGQTLNTADLLLHRDAANTLALRNGVNAQTFRVYNTFTDLSNLERGEIGWVSNTFVIRPFSAGTGLARSIDIRNASGNSVLLTSGSALVLASGIGTDVRLFAGDMYPGTTDGAIGLGTSSNSWANFFQGAAYHEMREMTAPAAPAANRVRIYAEDNGSGKTRLMAVFATGAAQQIAIEP